MVVQLRFLTVLLSIVVLLPGSTPANTNAEQQDDSCASRNFSVSLIEGEASAHRLTGWLCAGNAHAGRTVIVTANPGFSTSAYWDWPRDKDRYSFVRRFTRAGFSVFNYDRIGTGASDRPNAAAVNLQSEAYIAHQIVSRLRSGSVDGVAYDKVVLTGNSLSTLIHILEAEIYGDVDGLINTGIFVGPSPVGLATLFSALYPAQLDRKFSGDPTIPLGYATTQPGSRAAFFHLPSADPSTVRLDEELKDTGTVGEATTFPIWYPLTRRVNVPVLSVVGDHDILACLDVCKSDGVEVKKEQLFWSPAACLQVEILPEAGHFLQLQEHSAAAFFAIAERWLERRIGNDVPPSDPC